MLVTIKRSDEYVKAQRITTGQNVPDRIRVEIDPATLNEQTRRTLIEWWGSYPDDVSCIGYDGTFNLYPRYMGVGRFDLELDAEAQDVTPQHIDALIAAIPGRIRAKQDADRAAEAENKALQAEAQRQKLALVEALNPIIDAYLADPAARPTGRDTYWLEISGRRIEHDHPRWNELRDEQNRRDEIDEQARYSERNAWIAAHGSARLKRLLAEGIELENTYLSERIALERPGWAYDCDRRGEARQVRNARQEGLDLLDEARKIDPDATLVWWTITHEHDDCEDTGDCPVYDWKGYACSSTFLGIDIVYGIPDEYAC